MTLMKPKISNVQDSPARTRGNVRSKERNRPMYVAPDVIAIGLACNSILGIKPFCMNAIDSEGIAHRCDPVDEIDET